MNEPRPAIGVSAIVFDATGRVLLVQRATPPAAGYWHAPGGKLEAGESIVDACRREVREETGLDVYVGPLMAVVERRQEGFHYIILDFLAHLVDGPTRAPVPSDDVADARWLTLEELQCYPVAEGLLPILDRALLAHQGQPLGLYDADHLRTDFVPLLQSDPTDLAERNRPTTDEHGGAYHLQTKRGPMQGLLASCIVSGRSLGER